jgi:N-hydroxyarylamine O-acetyltransferase
MVLSELASRYLDRIGVVVSSRAADLGLLTELQGAHLVSVPFENTDVFHRRGVRTDLDWSLPKIVDRRRGGWCFELNGGFGWLLESLGYRVDRVSCQVYGSEGWGPPLDHCALVVHLDGERWLVDVGFGDCCMVPVPITPGEHQGVPRRVRFELDGDTFRLSELALDGEWVDTLQGRFEPRTLDDFTPRSDYLQTEPGLAWTEKPFATRATATDGSRVTLRGGLLRIRQGTGEYDDRPVNDPIEWADLLLEHFGLTDSASRAEELSTRSPSAPRCHAASPRSRR